MTDSLRELDCQMAQLLGWPILSRDDKGFRTEHQGDHAWLCNPANYPHFTTCRGVPSLIDKNYLPLMLWSEPEEVGVSWNPSENIAQAMLIVKTLRRDHDFHVFELRFVAVWMARFQNILTGAKGGFSAGHPSVSASEVICRAARKAVQSNGIESYLVENAQKPVDDNV